MMRDSKRTNSKGEFTDCMSAEELKSRFYDHFRNTGTLADLRSQLRSKLVNEMFKVASSQNETDSNDDAGDPLLPLQIGNWLVYDHMKRLGMEYSLSTFVSEANLPYPKKLLSIKDILHIFGIESHSPEYEVILSAYANNSKEGFLYIFISTLIKKTGRDDTKDLISQPEAVQSCGDTKHFSLSDYYPSKVFNETFNDFESPFKDAIPNTEAIAYKQLQQEKDRHEKEIKQLRQKLLTELDTLYTHEQEARMEIERKKMKLVHDQELMNLQKEKLKMKELEFEGRAKSLELESEARLNSLKESLLQKKKELDEKESSLNEMQQRFTKEQAELKAKQILSDASETQFTQLQKSYKMLQDEYTTILNENGRFQMELKQMSDYSAIKEELVWKSKKLEHVEEMMLLRSQLHQERLLSLQSVQRLQQQIVNEASMHQLVGQNISNGLVDPLVKNEAESQEPVSQSSQQYKELLTKIEDQRQDIQELHRMIHNLHYQPFSKQDQATSTGPLQSMESGIISPKDTLSRKSSDQKLLQQKLYEETNRRIEELVKETDAMERKYSEYMFGRPILYPNIYFPYNSTTTPLHLEATKLPSINGNSSFQNFSSSFRNFDLKFGSAADYDSKFPDRLLPATCPGDQERTHHMQKFLELLHRDVTPNPTYDMDSKFKSHLNATQTFSDPFSNISTGDNFTSRKDIEEASTDGQKLVFRDTFKSGKARLDDVKYDNTSTLLQPKHDTSHSQIMQESVLIVGPASKAADSNVDAAPDMPFPTTGSKVEDTSSVQQNHENHEIIEECNTVGSKLHDGNKEDSCDHPLQSTTLQMKHDSIYKLDSSAYEPKKLVSSTSLEPMPISKEPNNSVVDDLPIDLDAVWKQQMSKPKEYIFKINSNNINTLGLNEEKTAISKNLVDPRDTVKRKLSFNENPSQDSNSLLNSTSLNGASQLNPISKTKSMLNSTLDENTLKLNSAAETDQPFVDLSEAVSLKSSASGKTSSQLNLASEKDTLRKTSVSGDAAPLLNIASLSEKAAAPLNLVSEKDAFSLNQDSFSEKAASPLNPVSEKDESPLNPASLSEKAALSLNPASLSEKAALSLNPVSEKDESPLNPASLSEKAALSLNPVSETDLSQQKSSVKLEQGEGLSQKSSENPKSENNNSPHDTNTKSKSASLEQQASILNSTTVEQPTPESIQVERRISVDEQASGSKKYDEPGPLHELETRNSVSEISSGELDEKDSSNANASELSALNLSAGSELEQTKGEEDEDGW